MNRGVRSLIFTSMGHFSNDGNFLLFPVLITYYSLIPGISLILLGAVAIIYNALSGLLSTPIGHLADRTDRDGLLLAAGIAINGSSVGVFAIPFLYHSLAIPAIIGGSVLLGLGQSFYHPIGATIITESFDKKTATKMLGINGSFGSLGRALLPTVIVAVMILAGDTDGLLLIMLYLFIFAIVIYAGLRNFKRNSNKPKKGKGETNTVNRSIVKKYSKFLYILTLVIFVRSMFLTGTITFVPTFLTNVYHSRTEAVAIVTISFVTAIFGQPYFGSLTSKFGGRKIISFTTIISGVAFASFIYFASNLIVSATSFAVFAFVTYSGFPVLLGYVNQVVPREISTTSNGLVWGVGQTLGGALGIAVLDGFKVFVSLGDSLTLMLIFALAAIVLLPLIPRNDRLPKSDTPSTESQ
ncbi:MAG: MFS transporter [Thermoplasmataceae archaeon]